MLPGLVKVVFRYRINEIWKMSKPRVMALSPGVDFPFDDDIFSDLRQRITRTSYKEPRKYPVDVTNDLLWADVLVVASEEVVLDSERIDSLRRLDLILCPKKYLSVVDLGACLANEIKVLVYEGDLPDAQTIELFKTWLNEQTEVNIAVTARFDQNASEIVSILRDKGIDHLYHANTLATA